MSSTILRYRHGSTERFEGICEVELETQIVRLVEGGGEIRQVPFGELKAIFFLHQQALVEDVPRDLPSGSILTVEFEDGELIRGIATDYRPGGSGFMLHPLDRSGSERIFVVASAIVSTDVEKL